MLVDRIVGDDLLVTNPIRVQKAIDEASCNALLLKVNQIGSVTESIEAVSYPQYRWHLGCILPRVPAISLRQVGMAQQAGWGVMTSHRSGETEDTFIADLAVGLCTGQVRLLPPLFRAAKRCILPCPVAAPQAAGCRLLASWRWSRELR